MANRFSQPITPYVINPISVDTFMKVPLAKAAAMKSTMANFKEDALDFNVSEQDRADMNSLADPILKAREDVTERMYSEGLSDDLIANILQLRRDYTQFDRQRKLAENNKAKVDKLETQIDEVHTNKEYAYRVKEREIGTFEGTFLKDKQGNILKDEKGNTRIREFKGSAGPTFRNYGDEFRDAVSKMRATLVADGISEQEWTLDWESVDGSETEKALVFNVKNAQQKSSNYATGMNRLNSLITEYLDPQTERGEFAAYDIAPNETAEQKESLRSKLTATAKDIMSGYKYETTKDAGIKTSVVSTTGGNKNKEEKNPPKGDGQRGVGWVKSATGYTPVQHEYSQLKNLYNTGTAKLEDAKTNLEVKLGLKVTGNKEKRISIPGTTSISGNSPLTPGTEEYYNALLELDYIKEALSATPEARKKTGDAIYSNVINFMEGAAVSKAYAKEAGLDVDATPYLDETLKEMASNKGKYEAKRDEIIKETKDGEDNSEELLQLEEDYRLENYELYNDYAKTISHVQTELTVTDGNSSWMKDIRSRDFSVPGYVKDVANDMAGASINVMDLNSRVKIPVSLNNPTYSQLYAGVRNFSTGNNNVKGGVSLTFLGNATGDENFYNDADGNYVPGLAYGSVVVLHQNDDKGQPGKAIGTFIIGPRTSERGYKRYQELDEKIKAIADIEVGKTYSGTFDMRNVQIGLTDKGKPIMGNKVESLEIAITETGTQVVDFKTGQLKSVPPGTKVIYVEENNQIIPLEYTHEYLSAISIDKEQKEEDHVLKTFYGVAIKNTTNNARATRELNRKTQEDLDRVAKLKEIERIKKEEATKAARPGKVNIPPVTKVHPMSQDEIKAKYDQSHK